MKKIFLASLLIGFSFAFCHNVLAVGIISQPISIEDAMRGQIVEDQLQLINSKDEEISFDLSAGGDIADWTTYYTIGDIEKPLNQALVSAKSSTQTGVLIKVPDGTPNGEYKGSLIAFYKPSKKESSEDKILVSISQKFTRQVTITVTDTEIVKLKAMVMPIKYIIAPNKPLQIRLIYTNQGNIAIRPQAQIKIFQDDGAEIFDAIYPYPKKEIAVKPLKTKEIIVSYNTGELAEGKYRAEAVITLNGEELHKDDFTFSISIEDADDTNKTNKHQNFIASIGGGNMIFGYLLIAGFILASLLIVSKKVKKVKK